MRPLTVLAGGRNRAEVVQVERRTWDEVRIALVVSRGDRLAHANQQRRLLTAALAALYRVTPDVDQAERFLTASLRLLAQETTRAAADIEDRGPDPVAEAVAA